MIRAALADFVLAGTIALGVFVALVGAWAASLAFDPIWHLAAVLP